MSYDEEKWAEHKITTWASSTSHPPPEMYLTGCSTLPTFFFP